MMTGVALAQGMSSESSSSTQSTTTTVVPPVGSYNSTETRRSTDSNGVETDKSSSYNSGPNGSKATSSSRTSSPDGSVQSMSHEKQTESPDGVSTTSKKTTTTTTTDQ
jgi:hypothetical protein